VCRQRRQLGTENKSLAGPGVKEGLFAKTIATAKKLGPFAVVKRKGPHAVEAPGQLASPFCITPQEYFRVRMIAPKLVPSFLQLMAELALVINFPVINNDVAAILA